MIGNIGLIGVPSSAGARQVGQELAPEWLRKVAFVDRLQMTGCKITDFGDLPQISFRPDVLYPKKQNLPVITGLLRQVAQAVDRVASQGAFPLVLGGDCTICLGAVAGLVKHFPNLGLIYFDGDLDLNTPETTVSGIFDGMGLAHIIGEGSEELCRLGPRYPLLQEQHITLFGYSVQAGGIDPPEIERLRKSHMEKYPVSRVKGKAGLAASQAVRDLEDRVDHILVHFDVDVLDFDDFPAADVPHRSGLTLAEAEDALSVFLGSSKVGALVLSEFNANRDSDTGLARRLVDSLIRAIRPEPEP